MSAVKRLASHLTDNNYLDVLNRATDRSIKEIEELIAELSPKPDVATSIRALPQKRMRETVDPSELVLKPAKNLGKNGTKRKYPGHFH